MKRGCFKGLKYALEIEGVMPERALLRLKRGGISLYNVKKSQKNTLRLRVKAKDIEKVFAIYPNVCYNIDGYRPYKVRLLGGVGLARALDFLRARAGLLLGALGFCILTLAADSFVFGVDFVGSSVYAREGLQAIAESGVRIGAPYKAGKEDEIAAKLLSLPSVDFCSVQKVGHRLRVEMRLNPLSKESLQSGEMRAKHGGTILHISVLRGSALKKAGDTVAEGETLVGDWFSVEEGGQVRVEPIARVRISCAYESIHECADEQTAFAEAYLALDLSERDKIVKKEITKTQGGYLVKIAYEAIETVNL